MALSFKQFFTVSIFIDVVVSNPVIVLSSSKMEKTYTFVSASFDDNHLSLSISSATRQFLACNKLLNSLISHVMHLFPICRWCPAHDHSPPMNTQRNYGKRTPRACKYAPNGESGCIFYMWFFSGILSRELRRRNITGIVHISGCICRFTLGFCKNIKKRTETLYQSFSPFMVEHRGFEPLAF